MAKNLRDRLYISTVAADAVPVAQEHGLGLEIADFCVASNMDTDSLGYGALGEEKMRLGARMTFHFPFAELHPCAIDPLARDLAMRRHRQALRLARSHGINKYIIHAGFIPQVYYPEWFVSQSVEYWRSFLENEPGDYTICLENVMETGPELMLGIVEQVGDTRLRLCLDIGHAVHSGGGAAAPWIEKCGSYISHVHLHNNDLVRDRHWPLDRGQIDIKTLLHQLLGAAPEASWAIECQSAASSAEWLQREGFLI